mgnify:CR=1 FL=1|tara:strand:+ start:260 stop:517 length:258 start_codon:yes stop_codon:yes gene_type:complete
MSQNKEDLKNKIIYRASYRGSKEMDILMIGFVRKIIDNLDITHLKALNKFINFDDETLILLKKEESLTKINDPILINIIDSFKKF